MLGVDEARIDEAAEGLDPEDGVLWINDDTDDGVMGFTEFGIENLRVCLEEMGVQLNPTKLP
jgi:hypothetical protein